MPRSSEVALVALLLGASAAGGAPAKPASALALAHLSYVERRAELSSPQGWHEAKEGTAMRPCPSDHAVGAHPRRSR